MKLFTLTLALAAALAGLAGCGKKEEPVAPRALEDSRAMSRANAEYNAQLYRAASPRFTDHKIVGHADESISPECPQGDGWASISIMKVDDKLVDKKIVICSTVSQSLGCYLDVDFVKKPFAGEEGHCQATTKVPYPLPKLGS